MGRTRISPSPPAGARLGHYNQEMRSLKPWHVSALVAIGVIWISLSVLRIAGIPFHRSYAFGFFILAGLAGMAGRFAGPGGAPIFRGVSAGSFLVFVNILINSV
jgi:hypothetical protein